MIRLSSIRQLSMRIAAAALLVLSAVPASAQGAPQPQRVLGREDIVLYGLGLKVEPGYQTVPKDIATIVSTFLQAPNVPDGVPPFAPDAVVAATLRGPSFANPVELRVTPNTPFNIPPLTVPGVHVVENIRLISGGEVLLRGTPDHVTIDVIEKLLITQVTARPLSAAEIRERNIAFDASNFQAYNFSAAFAIGDQPIQLNFPVLLPKLQGASDASTPTTSIPAIAAPSMPTLSTIIPDTLKLQTQIPNLSVVGFTLKVPTLSGQSFVVPPIPGVVVIPGDIGFLNQYFSVMLMVGNVAPAGSNLVVTNLKAQIVLPPDRFGVADSTEAPLRMAQTTRGESPRIQLVAQPGPDGKVGTADDIPSLGPGESGNAEYLVEGRREGSHVVEMRITGTLNGLPVGPVTVTGTAAGAVLVRNPNFTLTFTHPDVVSAGEPYTLDVTVSNTSASPANFVSVNLYPRNVSGATIVGEPSRTIESLPAGDSATISFRLLSKKTGKVTAATLDSDENVAGRFSLKAAVGELGVPLSPDSLVLPKEANGLQVPGDNPDDLKQAALGLLGKAHAVATAPAAALPPDVRRFSRKIVIDRAIQVAEAGLRVSLGEPLPTSAGQLLMDFMGSDYSRLSSLFPKPEDQAFEKNNVEGFDDLRRRSIRGDQFAAAVGRVLAPRLAAATAQQFHYGLAQAWSYRPAHVAVLVSGNGQPLPARFSLSDAQHRRVGTAGADGKIVKEIPFSDVVDITNASGDVTARLIVLAAPQPGTFQIDAEPPAGAPANAAYIVSIVAPDAAGGLRQIMSPLMTFPQHLENIGAASDPYKFVFNAVGGSAVASASTTPVIDPGPTVLSVIQQGQADVLKCEQEDPGVPVGRIVAVLFSEEVTPASVQDRLAAADITHFSVENNRVVGVALQPGRRIAFLALRDPFGPFVDRQITIDHVKDVRGNEMQPWTGKMTATVPDTGGVVSGRVLNADGTPVPFANVRLFSMLVCEAGEPNWAGISSKPADASGKYQFDYVTRLLNDRLLAVNQETGESRNVRFNVQRNGQQLNVDIVFLGRGTFAGTTLDERGHALAGTALRVSSLTDGSQYGATTDAAGRFTIPGVPVGNFFVEAVNVAASAQFSFSEYMPAASATVTREITLLDVATRTIIVKHGALSGHVLRADGVSAAAAVPVIVWYQHLSQPGVSCPGTPAPAECAIAMMNTDAQGAFAFAGLTAGELRLQTFDQGALSQGQARLVLAADASAQVNVLLSGGLGTVNGIVLDAAQQPVAGARVGGGLSLATTDSQGRFTLTDVPVGRYPIVAVSDALGSRGEVMVDIVQAGQVVNAAIRLAAVGAISGNVVRADGLTPVPNVDVYVFSRAAGGISVVGSGKTDANGGFMILSVPAGSYQVSAFNASFTDGDIVPATVRFQGETFRTTIRFRGAGGKITGKVLDDDGQTPLKARVAVSGDQLVVAGNKVGVEFKHVNYFQVADTDFTTGAYTFGNLWVGPVTVSAIGQFSPDPISVETAIPAPNATVTVNLRLQATAQIKGVVLLPNGAQPAGANIVVKYKSDAFKVICTESSGGEPQCDSIPQGIQEETVATDAQGRFWLPVVNAGTFTLTVDDPASGKVGTIKGNVKPGEIANLSVRLFGKGEVTVKVLGSNRTTPIAGAHVDVQQLGYPQKKLTFTADNTGTVLLTGGDALAEGLFVINATDPSTGFAGRAQGRVTADGEELTVQVFLYNAAGTVSGSVFGPDGFTPVPNAEVIVSGAGGPLAFTVTGGDGRYSVGTVPVGNVGVEIFEAKTGRRGAASGRVDADGQIVAIDVVEAAIGMVKGQVLQEATLEPLKGWTVMLTQQSPSGLSLPGLQTMTGVDGAYSFPGASRGAFTLRASSAGVQAQGTAHGAIEREGQVVEMPVLVSILRTLTGGISGKVVSASGIPVGNVALEFCLPNRCADAGNLQITSAADGTFVVSDIPLGRFSVTARSQGTGDSGSAVGEITFDGEVATVTVVMSGLARITGQVVRGDNSPAANVQLSLAAYPTSGCAGDCSQSTDGSGNFTFINIPGQTFTITATDPATGLKGVAGGSLNPGEQKTVRIVLEPTSTMSGRVLTSSGSPANGAIAELIVNPNAGNERRLYRETGLDGTFNFPAVPLTQYVLNLKDPVGSGIAVREGTLVGPLPMGDIVLDQAPPQIASLAPAAGSRGAVLNTNVTVTFTEPILPGTINADNVKLLGPNGPVLATLDVTTNDTVVVIDPIADLKDETTYTVQITNVKDRVQKLMPAPYVASFATRDITRPTVVEASPAASASGVTIYTPVRIKFSEAIDTTKFTGAPIVVTGPNGGALTGGISYLFGNTVVVFTPNLPLAEDTTYQVTVKKATDLAGLQQLADSLYSFRTTTRIPPTLEKLEALNDGKVIEGGIGRVKATPSATSDVLFVDFYVNGTLAGTDRSSPFEFAFQANPSLGGPGAIVTVTAVPTDTSGNRGIVPLSRELTIVADQPAAVQVAVTTPSGTLSAKNGDHIVVSTHATDDLGLKQLGYRAATGNPADAQTKVYTPAVAEKTEGFAFNIPATAAPGSTIRVEASAVDTKGQVSQATPVDITVLDAALPVVEITGATTGTTVRPGQSTTVFVTASDLGGIRQVTFTAGGLVTRTDTRAIDPAQNAVVTGFTVTVPTTAQPGQTLTLDATATDRAGNVGTAARLILPVADLIAPTASLHTETGKLTVAPGQAVNIVVGGEDEGLLSELRLAASGAMTFSTAKQVTPPSGSASRTFEVIVPASLASGAQIQLAATAVDMSGNVSTPATLTLTVASSVDVTLPASQIVKAGKTATVTVQLAEPAPVNGLRLDFALDNANLAEVTPSVTFAEGETSRTFELKGVAGGTTTLRALYQSAVRATMTVTVSGGIVTGTVLDSQLHPVAGAQVTVSGGGVTVGAITAADGSFEVQGIPGPGVSIKAFDPVTHLRGYEAGSMNAPNGTFTRTIILIPAGAIEGTVSKADGSPAGSGVRVDIFESGHGTPLATVFTDTDSHYAFPLVTLGQYTVLASATDGNRGLMPVSLVESGKEVTLPIQYLGYGSLKVTVVNGSNAPVPNAQLTLRTWDVFGTGTPVITNADGSGTFTFDHVNVGSFSVDAKEAGTGQAGNIAGSIVNHQQVLERTITLASFGSIHGTVSRPGGAPVAGAKVAAAGRLVTANESGVYRFDILPLGTYTLSATDPGTRGVGSAIATLSQSGQDVPANITLADQGRLLVTVRDAGGVAVPSAFIQVSVTDGKFTDSMSATADANGTALFEHVLEGTASVTAMSGALAGRTDNVAVTAGTTVPVTVSLEPTGTITGTVYEPIGQTPASAGYVRIGDLFSQRIAQIGPDGVYKYELLPKGPYALYVFDGSNRLRAFTKTDVVISTNGQVVTQPFTMIGLAKVSGTVTFSDGRSAQNFPVTLNSLNPDFGGVRGTSTDAGGNYEFTGVPIGAFTVTTGDPDQHLLGEANGAITLHGKNEVAPIVLQNNAVTLPQTLFDGNDYGFTVLRSGEIATGSAFGASGQASGFPGGASRLELVANGASQAFQGDPISTSEDAQREFATRETNLHGLTVTRKIAVPADGYFTRELELLTNPGSTPVTVDVRITSVLRPFQNTPASIVATSSGDTTFSAGTAADRWVVVGEGRPSSGCCVVPARAFVVDGGGAQPLGTANVAGTEPRSLSYGWTSVTVQPGQTVGLLHFVVEQTSNGAAQAAAERLAQLPPEALQGLSPQEMGQIVNFAMPSDGHSAVAALPALNGTINGQVLDADAMSTPAASAKVFVETSSVLYHRQFNVTAGADGRFSINSIATDGNKRLIPLEPYTLRAQYNRTQAMSPDVAGVFLEDSAVSTTNITFSNAGIITGAVTRANGDAVQTGTVEISGGSFAKFTVNIGDGAKYRFSGLQPGTYTLRGTVPVAGGGTGLTVTGIATAVAGGTTVLNLPLPQTFSVGGTVLRASGAGAAGVSISLKGQSDSFQRSATTGTGGAFAFADVAPGNYVLVATEPRTSITSSTGVVVTDTGVSKTITLVAVGSVSGTITLKTGGPAIDRTVSMRYTLASGVVGFLSAQTSTSGAYQFTDVPASAFTLEVNDTVAHLYGTASGQLTTDGQNVPLSFVLDVNTVNLPLNLYDANGFLYSIQRDGVSNPDNYRSGARILQVAGGGVISRFDGGSVGIRELAGRQVRQTGKVGQLDITRTVYVPQRGYFTRYVDTFHNSTSQPLPLEFYTADVITSDWNAPTVQTTSSGDAVLTATGDPAAVDRWVVFDDSIDLDPFLAGYQGGATGALWAGAGSTMSPDSVNATVQSNFSRSGLTTAWSGRTIQPGETISVMHFLVTQTSRAAAKASLERLAELPNEAIEGLTDQERATIRNFVVPQPGTSTAEPLPSLEGTVQGHVYGSIGDTLVNNAVVRLQSKHPIFARSYQMTTSQAFGNGFFRFVGSMANASSPVAIPVADYTVTATINNTNATASADGVFGIGETTSTTDVRITQSGSLTGILRRSKGGAVAGVTVTDNVNRSVTTDADGRFTFENFKPGTASVTARLSAQYPDGGYDIVASRNYTIVAGQITEGDLTLPPAGALDGYVRYADGTPAPYVGVSAYTAGFVRYTSTDDQGHYHFNDLLAGPYQVQSIDPRTQRPTTVNATITDGGTALQNLQFAAVGSVTVTVTLSGGQAAPNAGVWLDPDGNQSWPYFGSTDANGQVTFSTVPAAATIAVRASHPLNSDLYGFAQTTLAQEGQNAGVVVTLPPTGTVTGTLTTAAGQILANADLQLRDPQTDDAIRYATSDGQGHFLFTGVPTNRPLWLAVDNYRRSNLRRHGTVFTLNAEGAAHDENISRPAVANVQVKVTHPDGSAWSNLLIYGKDSVDTMFAFKGFTDASGNVMLWDTAEGAYAVAVFTGFDGIKLGDATGTVAPADDEKQIQLAVPIAAVQGGVSGTIVAADETTPVPGAIVKIINVDDGKVAATMTTTSSGAYSFSSQVFSQGGFRITAQLPNDPTIVGSATGAFSSEGQAVALTVKMPVFVGTISGTVKTTGGVPVAGAVITVKTPSATTTVQVSTSEQGSYTIGSYVAPVSGFTVSAQAGGVTKESPASFELQRTIEVNFELPVQTVSFSVRVLGGDRQTPARSTQIYVNGTDGSFLGYGDADVNGLVTIGPILVPAAGFTLNASYRDEPMVMQTVTTFDPAVPIEFVLPLSVVKGQVTFASGAAVPSPSVWIEDANGITRQATSTTANGEFVILGTAVGPFRATAQDRTSNILATLDSAVVSIETAVVLTIPLPPTGTVTGTLFDDKGNPLAEEGVSLASERLAFTRWTYTDSNGVYRFDNVPVGPVSLYSRIWTSDGQLFFVGAGTVTANGTLTIPLHPVDMATLSGRLVRADGTPEANGWIDIAGFGGASPDGYYEDSVQTGADGTFTFERVPLGMVKITGYDADFGKFGVTNVLFGATTGIVTVTLGTAVETDYTLTGDNGFRYKVTSTGGLYDGGLATTPSDSRPYSGTYESTVNNDYFCCDYYPALSGSGRQLTFGPKPSDLLLQTRKVFVPQSGAFVRYLDIIENPLAVPVKATLEISAYLNQNASRSKVVVAPGTTGNTYVVFDDSLNGRTPTAPALAHVFAGAGNVSSKAVLSYTPKEGTSNYTEYRWTVTVPPNGRVALLHFGVLRDPADAAGAASQAISLVNLTDLDALAGLSAEEKAAIKNFIIPAPGGGGQ